MRVLLNPAEIRVEERGSLRDEILERGDIAVIFLSDRGAVGCAAAKLLALCASEC